MSWSKRERERRKGQLKSDRMKPTVIERSNGIEFNKEEKRFICLESNKFIRYERYVGGYDAS